MIRTDQGDAKIYIVHNYVLYYPAMSERLILLLRYLYRLHSFFYLFYLAWWLLWALILFRYPYGGTELERLRTKPLWTNMSVIFNACAKYLLNMRAMEVSKEGFVNRDRVCMLLRNVQGIWRIANVPSSLQPLREKCILTTWNFLSKQNIDRKDYIIV